MMSASARRNAGTAAPCWPRQNAIAPSAGRMLRSSPAAATGRAAAASACACARTRKCKVCHLYNLCDTVTLLRGVRSAARLRRPRGCAPRGAAVTAGPRCWRRVPRSADSGSCCVPGRAALDHTQQEAEVWPGRHAGRERASPLSTRARTRLAAAPRRRAQGAPARAHRTVPPASGAPRRGGAPALPYPNLTYPSTGACLLARPKVAVGRGAGRQRERLAQRGRGGRHVRRVQPALGPAPGPAR